jgi:hypothetical protein
VIFEETEMEILSQKSFNNENGYLSNESLNVYLDKNLNLLYFKCQDQKWIGFKKFKIIGKSKTYNAKEFFLSNMKHF